MANHWYRMSKNIKPRFKAENFDSSINYDLTTSSSYVVMNFVNGWKQGFYFREATNETFIQMTQMTNKLVECIYISLTQLREPWREKKTLTTMKNDLLTINKLILYIKNVTIHKCALPASSGPELSIAHTQEESHAHHCPRLSISSTIGYNLPMISHPMRWLWMFYPGIYRFNLTG